MFAINRKQMKLGRSWTKKFQLIFGGWKLPRGFVWNTRTGIHFQISMLIGFVYSLGLFAKWQWCLWRIRVFIHALNESWHIDVDELLPTIGSTFEVRERLPNYICYASGQPPAVSWRSLMATVMFPWIPRPLFPEDIHRYIRGWSELW